MELSDKILQEIANREVRWSTISETCNGDNQSYDSRFPLGHLWNGSYHGKDRDGKTFQAAYKQHFDMGDELVEELILTVKDPNGATIAHQRFDGNQGYYQERCPGMYSTPNKVIGMVLGCARDGSIKRTIKRGLDNLTETIRKRR